jgi:hypothetical protein
LIAGRRFTGCSDARALLSKLIAPPALPPSVMATSAQFQNSSGADDWDVHELVVT